MNIEVSELSSKLTALLPKLTRYIPIMFALVLITIYVFFGLQISTLAEAKLSPQAIETKEDAIKEVTIDENVVNAMRQLRERSITVESTVKPGDDPDLNNPFQE